MVTLTENQLKKLQRIELELLLEVDRICRKHSIKYSIAGGTLLGAVRHKGFIPWDDDADVGMLREEYEKFRIACEAELDNDRFYFQDHKCTKGYRWGYGKLRRKNTLFLREHQEHMPYEQGVFIDIFPIDGVSNNYFVARFNQFHCFCVRKILWSSVGKVADSSKYKRKVYSMLSKINEKIILQHYDAMILKSYHKSSKNVRVLMFPMPNGIHDALRECFEKTTPILFEGYYLQAADNYEYYLHLHYGNYMELPPLEKRKIHPVSAITLIDTEI